MFALMAAAPAGATLVILIVFALRTAMVVFTAASATPGLAIAFVAIIFFTIPIPDASSRRTVLILVSITAAHIFVMPLAATTVILVLTAILIARTIAGFAFVAGAVVLIFAAIRPALRTAVVFAAVLLIFVPIHVPLPIGGAMIIFVSEVAALIFAALGILALGTAVALPAIMVFLAPITFAGPSGGASVFILE